MLPVHIIAWDNKRSKTNTEHVAAHASLGTTKPATKKRKVKSKVLETKGGGQAMPQQPSPMEQAQAREYESNLQFEREERRRAAERTLKQEQDAQALQRWQGGRNSSYNAAISNAGSRLRGMGLDNDPYGIMGMFRQRVDANNSALQDNQDYSTAFAPTIFDDVIGEVRGTKRTGARRNFESTIGRNFADDTFADDVDDPILDSIIGSQFETASNDLRNALNRGQLQQSAFDRAMGDLGNTRTTARREADDIGMGVLSTNRNAIGRLRDDALSNINSLELGDQFDARGESERIMGRANSRKTNLDADIRRAIGSRTFFDTNSTINRANSALGATNTGTPTTGGQSLYNVFAQPDRSKQQEGMF